jgi:hypothetical protein
MKRIKEGELGPRESSRSPWLGERTCQFNLAFGLSFELELIERVCTIEEDPSDETHTLAEYEWGRRKGGGRGRKEKLDASEKIPAKPNPVVDATLRLVVKRVDLGGPGRNNL